MSRPGRVKRGKIPFFIIFISKYISTSLFYDKTFFNEPFWWQIFSSNREPKYSWLMKIYGFYKMFAFIQMKIMFSLPFGDQCSKYTENSFLIGCNLVVFRYRHIHSRLKYRIERKWMCWWVFTCREIILIENIFCSLRIRIVRFGKHHDSADLNFTVDIGFCSSGH